MGKYFQDLSARDKLSGKIKIEQVAKLGNPPHSLESRTAKYLCDFPPSYF